MILLRKETVSLWLWIFLTLAQWSRQFMDESFRPQTGTASARFFQYPEIAAFEACVVLGLLALTYVVGIRQRWIVICACAATLAIAFYHQDTYSIGVDMLLILAVAPVLAAYLKSERPV
jgi:sugar phosphate permease